MFPVLSQEFMPKKINIGTLAEIPQICINAFSNPIVAEERIINFNKSLAFFITHLDEDLLNDLFNPYFFRRLEYSDDQSIRLYMHKNSFRGIKYWVQTLKTSQPYKDETLALLDRLYENQKIILLERNIPILLEFQKRRRRSYRHEVQEFYVEVTPLSAGHNPGSIMLLFETEGDQDENDSEQRILYTGNCRVTLNDLETTDALMTKDGKPKTLTSLYIDTTNCIEAIKELPLRKEVEESLLKIIKMQLKANPSTGYEIWFSFCLSSSLNLLRRLYQTFFELIHIPPKVGNFFAKLEELQFIGTIVDGEITPFHYSCKSSDKNKYCGFNREIEVYDIYLYADLFPQFPTNHTAQMKKWYKDKEHVYLEGNYEYHALYASNLSRYEMGRMINYFHIHPFDVKPLYLPESKTRKQVQDLLAATCFKLANTMPELDINNNEIAPITGTDFSELYDFTGPNLSIQSKKEVLTFVHIDPKFARGFLYPSGDTTSRH